MGKGFMGKVLWVDLTSGEISEEVIPETTYEKYLAGLGLGAHICYERIPAGADALGPDNILGILPGLLTGTGSIFSGRWMVVGKSPLTGGWGDANCGGTFAPSIKRSGYDGIFFKGISEKPVYLYVKDGQAELKDASHYWGKDTVEAEEELIEAHGKNAKVALIGPAGERLSLIAGVCNDRGRIAARSGLGAVMGSKRLKAVVLDGRKRIEVSNKSLMKSLTEKSMKFINLKMPLPGGWFLPLVGAFMRIMPTQMMQDGFLFKQLLAKWGTIFQNQYSLEAGDSPVKNWKGSLVDFNREKSSRTGADLIINREKNKYHCYSCPLGCGGICSMTGRYSETHKPEYETVLALGGLLMNDDLESIFYLNEYLNRAGMDSISAGGTIAFAMECFEKGILSGDDLGGLDLSWGNSGSIIKLAEMMVERKGMGDILADGSKKAAERIGKGSSEYAITAGGQELPMHDSRNDPGYALHYSAEPTPGRHTIGSQLAYEMYQLWKRVSGMPRPIPLYHKNSKYIADERKAKMAKACSDYMNVINASGLCWFGAMMGCTRVPAFDWLNAATGWNRSADEYMKIGAVIQSIKQAFNVKHGIDPVSFRIKDRCAGIPKLTEGANKGRTVDIDKLMNDYWKEYGWDDRGRPSVNNL
jgi:aldehyde:ferredoxin oxidoreductase